MTPFQITGIALATIYTDDYEANLHFYRDVVGLGPIEAMNDHSCYIPLGEDQGVYLVGGCGSAQRSEKQTGTSFAFNVSDINLCFSAIQQSGARMIHEAPVQMNEETYWFQCCDPAQNIIEFLGPRGIV